MNVHVYVEVPGVDIEYLPQTHLQLYLSIYLSIYLLAFWLFETRLLYVALDILE